MFFINVSQNKRKSSILVNQKINCPKIIYEGSVWIRESFWLSILNKSLRNAYLFCFSWAKLQNDVEKKTLIRFLSATSSCFLKRFHPQPQTRLLESKKQHCCFGCPQRSWRWIFIERLNSVWIRQENLGGGFRIRHRRRINRSTFFMKEAMDVHRTRIGRDMCFGIWLNMLWLVLSWLNLLCLWLNLLFNGGRNWWISVFQF